MKPSLAHLAVAGFLAGSLATACTTTGSPNQDAINATYTSYTALDQAILAADAAVKAGTLKGSDAQRTLTALTTSKAALDTALAVMKAATPPTTPTSGASK